MAMTKDDAVTKLVEARGRLENAEATEVRLRKKLEEAEAEVVKARTAIEENTGQGKFYNSRLREWAEAAGWLKRAEMEMVGIRKAKENALDDLAHILNSPV